MNFLEILFIALLLIIAALAITAGVIFLGIYPTNLRPDLSKIKPLENQVVVLSADKEKGMFNIAKKNPDGSFCKDFKIIGFTDLHFDGLNNRIQETYKWLCYNIEKEKPDLVLILGDTALCWGNHTRAKEVAEIMKAYGVYWSIVLGNHEGESRFELSREGFMKLVSSYYNCLAAVSIDGVNGYGNQLINIMASETQVLQSLYLMDSGDDTHYKYIKPSQVKWYERTLKETLQKNPATKSMVFMHIPLHKHSDAYDKVLTGELELLWGEGGESVMSSKSDETDSFLFQKAKELGSKQIFACGHDHLNYFGIECEGIALMYNQPSGYSCYDKYSTSKKRDPNVTEAVRIQGCTVYNIQSDRSVKVENRLNRDAKLQ